MTKIIKQEIEKYLNKNPQIRKPLKENESIEKINQCIPLKIKKGIKEIVLKNNKITIKTKTPSWRQEINFFKKEIIKKIHKKFRNYSEIKITIL